MAKATVKKAAKVATKAVAPKAAKPKTTKSVSIEEASSLALSKLKELGIDEQLQSKLEWCLGSFRHDGNPAGLLEFLPLAVKALEGAKANKVKGVTAKLIGDLSKALK